MRTVLLVFLFISINAVGQESKKESFGVEGKFTFETDMPFKLLEMEKDNFQPVVKKKKRKRRTFYGIKTRKRFVVKVVRRKKSFEIFYILKKPEKTIPLVRDIYWYSLKKRAIQKSTTFNPNKGVLLHGPYKKTVDGLIVEEGFFFKGSKHGRWMKHDNNDILVGKEKYYKGWPKESVITYYDPTERTKIKEMVPVQVDEREGLYFRFHENGGIAVTGEYKWDEKVGDWIENYPNGKRKKIISYSREPFDNDKLPYVRREWNEKGKVIYYSAQRRSN